MITPPANVRCRMTDLKRIPFIAIALGAGLSTLLPMLPGSGVSAQETLRACYVPNTGVVYRVGLEDTPDDCRSAKHVAFSWTDGAAADHGALTGLEDDDHPQYVLQSEVPTTGFSGVEYVVSEEVAEPGFITNGRALCPEGKVAIAGGYIASFPPGERIRGSTPFFDTIARRPGWIVQVNNASGAGALRFDVYALCVAGSLEASQ